MDLLGHAQAHQVEDRGQQVDVAHRPVHDASRAVARGGPDDQGGVNRRVVHEEAVERLAVVAEPLAVIAGEDDQRVVEEAALVEGTPEVADERVGVGHLAVVRPSRITRLERLLRRVRLVGVVEVEPEEERAAGGPSRRASSPRRRRSPRRRAAPTPCSPCSPSPSPAGRSRRSSGRSRGRSPIGGRARTRSRSRRWPIRPCRAARRAWGSARRERSRRSRGRRGRAGRGRS